MIARTLETPLMYERLGAIVLPSGHQLTAAPIPAIKYFPDRDLRKGISKRRLGFSGATDVPISGPKRVLYAFTHSPNINTKTAEEPIDLRFVRCQVGAVRPRTDLFRVALVVRDTFDSYYRKFNNWAPFSIEAEKYIAGMATAKDPASMRLRRPSDGIEPLERFVHLLTIASDEPTARDAIHEQVCEPLGAMFRGMKIRFGQIDSATLPQMVAA